MCKINKYKVNTPSEFACAAAPDDQVVAREDEDDFISATEYIDKESLQSNGLKSYACLLNGISAEMWHPCVNHCAC